MASQGSINIKCQCGDFSLTLVEGKPKVAGECFCVDCFQRSLIMEKAGAIKIRPEVRNRDHGIDLYSFQNAFLPPSAETKRLISFHKLREDASCTYLVAKCCQTIMCGVHPAYQGRTIWTYPDAVKYDINKNNVVSSNKSWDELRKEADDSSCMVFGCDLYPAEKRAKLAEPYQKDPKKGYISQFFNASMTGLNEEEPDASNIPKYINKVVGTNNVNEEFSEMLKQENLRALEKIPLSTCRGYDEIARVCPNFCTFEDMLEEYSESLTLLGGPKDGSAGCFAESRQICCIPTTSNESDSVSPVSC